MKKYLITLLLLLSASFIFAGAGSGTCVLSPSSVPVSSTAQTLTFTYTASENFGFGGRIILMKPLNAVYISDISLSSTDKGFITLDTTASITNVQTDTHSLTITVASLSNGNTVKIIYGDKTGGGAGLDLMTFSGAYTFPILTSPNGATPLSITTQPIITINAFTPTATPTFTKTITPSITITSTKTITKTITPSITITFTKTASPTPTITKTITPTITPRRSATNTKTITPTMTKTTTKTITPTTTKTSTPTITKTQTIDVRTATRTSTETATPTITKTATITKTSTKTTTLTQTKTNTQTITETATNINTPTITKTHTLTPTFTLTPTTVPYTQKPKIILPEETNHYYSALTLSTNSVGTLDNPLAVQEVNQAPIIMTDLNTNTINVRQVATLTVKLSGGGGYVVGSTSSNTLLTSQQFYSDGTSNSWAKGITMSASGSAGIVQIAKSDSTVIDSFGQTYTTMQTNNLPVSNTNPLYVSFTTQAIGVSPSTNSLNVGVVGLPSYIVDGQSGTVLMTYMPKGISITSDLSPTYKGVSIMASGTGTTKLVNNAGTYYVAVDKSGALVSTSAKHYEEHNGWSFVYGNLITAMATAVPKYIAFVIPAGITIHVQTNFVASDGSYTAQLFAGTVGGAGTTLTSYAVSKTVSYASTVKAYEDTNTLTAVASRPAFHVGSSATGGGIKSGGSVVAGEDDYAILGAGTFIWKITALTANVIGSWEIPFYYEQ